MGSVGNPDKQRENSHKRQAIQVAGMLPDDPREALIVLEFARGIIETTFGLKSEEALKSKAHENTRLSLVTQPRQSGRSGGDAG